jgi:hypothetical protein
VRKDIGWKNEVIILSIFETVRERDKELLGKRKKDKLSSLNFFIKSQTYFWSTIT